MGVAIIAALIISITACKKSDSNKDSDKTTTPVTASTPGNSTNAYDSIGYYHNDILSGIQPCVPADNKNANTIIGCIVQFDSAEKLVPPNSIISSVPQTVADQPNSFSNVINNSPYSTQAKALLDSLFITVEENASKTSYAAIKAPIIAFENQVSKNATLNSADKEVLLQAASVARYSVYYWMITNQDGKALKLKNLVMWIGAVTSDIAGAIVSYNPGYSAACSMYAWDLVNYSMP